METAKMRETGKAWLEATPVFLDLDLQIIYTSRSATSGQGASEEEEDSSEKASKTAKPGSSIYVKRKRHVMCGQ